MFIPSGRSSGRPKRNPGKQDTATEPPDLSTLRPDFNLKMSKPNRSTVGTEL